MNYQSLALESDKILAEYYAEIDRTAMVNQKRVLDAFQKHKVSERHFYATTGYGYNDDGRDTLDLVYAEVFGTPSALVRHNIISGTHALTIGLFALLRPGDTLLSVTGKPYDTLDSVIGINKPADGSGSLADFGIKYRQIELNKTPTDNLDLHAIRTALEGDTSIKVVFIQRSKGYMNRASLSCDEIDSLYRLVKEINPHVYVIVDNCYGEFVCDSEPRADMVIGSLIKNPGGGMAESGAYIAGSTEAVELAGYRLTCPAIGKEAGASLGQNKNIFKGLFFAPHVVACALKTAVFAAYIYEMAGEEVSPRYNEPRFDIIQTIKFGDEHKLCAFCRGIQKGSPVDSHVTPEPWGMPGYSHRVIMAAGTFVQGASIEISADAPIRPPYTAYLQGGLTFESGKLAVLQSLQDVYS